MTTRDMDGQPPRGIYIRRLVDRQISEMLGMAKGIICDGVVNDAEVVARRRARTRLGVPTRRASFRIF